MKKLRTLLLPILIPGVACGQQLSRSIITTAGDFSKNENGVSLSWSMGEVFSQTMLHDHHLTGGFQQGDFTVIHKAEKEIPSDEILLSDNNPTHSLQQEQPITVLVFPNRTADQLFLKFQNQNPQKATALLLDANGKTLFRQEINIENGKTQSLDHVPDLGPGVYFIQLFQNGKRLLSVSFIKI